jgi:hypothetical protein
MYSILQKMKVLKCGAVAVVETVHTVTENRPGRHGMKTSVVAQDVAQRALVIIDD